MGKRHKVLTDEIFKNSIYIHTINNLFELEDFKKEYPEQYNTIFDIFKTFILLNNIFFSDSNISNYNKVENATNLLEKMFKINKNDNVVGVKYSVRDIKELCDKYARHLYNTMGDWYYSLYNISSKNLDKSPILKKVKNEIEKEMNILSYSRFDNSVLGNLQFGKNVMKNYKDYTRYISKFDILYKERDEFIENYKNEFNSLYGITLNDNEINKFGLLFKLLSSVHNGLINIINNYKIDNFNINPDTNSIDTYACYLQTLNLDYTGDLSIDASKKFGLLLEMIHNKLGEDLKHDFKKTLENFDIYFFYFTMKECIYFKDIKFKTTSNIGNKLISDLNCIYDTLFIINMMKESLSEESIIDNYLIPLYKETNELIKKYDNIFERIS